MVFDGTWALTAPGVAHEDAVTDFFSRAVHTVTVAGKQFVQHRYAGALARSYFVGCSDGGREGLVEATRYPEDFEGYIVGDPFFDVPGQILAGRAARALVDAPDSYLPPALLTLVDNAVYANCDAVDGVRDALIQNPGACSFSPQSLLCSGGNTADCLTQSQVDTLSAWFAAATDAQGRVVSLGFPVSDLYNNGAAGNNLFRWTEAAGPPHDIHAAAPWGEATSAQPAGWAFYDQSFKYLVFLDPHVATITSPPSTAAASCTMRPWRSSRPGPRPAGATIRSSSRRSSRRIASCSSTTGTATASSLPSVCFSSTRSGPS